MEQKNLFEDRETKKKCDSVSCLACAHCKAINCVEKKPELKNNSSQLYAKESEQYLFYYASHLKQI